MLLKATLFGMMKIVIRICFGIPKVNVLDYSIGSMLAERATRSVASGRKVNYIPCSDFNEREKEHAKASQSLGNQVNADSSILGGVDGMGCQCNPVGNTGS